MQEMSELEKEFDDVVMKAVGEGQRLGYSASFYLEIKSARRSDGNRSQTAEG